VAASDATLQVGGAEDEGGYSVTSSTNTFTGLMSGVTLTASKLETGVTVDVSADTSGIADKIKAMVDAANDLLSEVGKQTAFNAGTGKGSTLTGDFMVRQISQAVLSTVSQGQADIGSLSKMGIELDRSGKLTFKKDTFEAAYKADPSTIQTAGLSFAETVEDLTIKQTADVTNAVTGRKSYIDSMNAQIDNWDIRLSARQEALTKQYASLETALSNLKSQSSYLSSQLG
jgi:flagellar hook-associated protein 2